jgi:hypothetical protein
MSSTMQEVQDLVRERLHEPEPLFWSESELHKILIAGVKDLWRDIVDLKAEHYLVVNDTDCYIPSGSEQMAGVPADVHKVYLIEPRELGTEGARTTLYFTPRDFNHDEFRSARSVPTIYPPYGEIFYAVTGQGSPVGAPTIRIAPKVSADQDVTLSYVPTLEPLHLESVVPIPGEADNALVAWGVAYARAKEREDRAPDANWLSIYGTEKQHLLQSLGLRQYQEPTITDGMFDALW